MFITSLRLIDRIVTERASDCGLLNLPTFHLFQTLARKEKAWSAAGAVGGGGAQPRLKRGAFGDDGLIITNVFLNVNMYVIIFVKIKKH